MRNKLFVYKGGGYDGCIWEWNAAVWDQYGAFRDVGSSGCTGLWTDRTLRDDAAREALARLWLKEGKNDAAVIDLTKKRQVKYFYREYNAMFAYGCMEKLATEIYSSQSGGRKVFLFWVCTDCGHELAFDSTPAWEDSHGDGGVGTVYESRLCEECYSAGTCRKCDAYWGKTQLQDYGYCVDCFKQLTAPVQSELDDIERTVDHINDQTKEMASLRPKYATKHHAQAAKLIKRLEKKRHQVLKQVLAK